MVYDIMYKLFMWSHWLELMLIVLLVSALVCAIWVIVEVHKDERKQKEYLLQRDTIDANRRKKTW